MEELEAASTAAAAVGSCWGCRLQSSGSGSHFTTLSADECAYYKKAG